MSLGARYRRKAILRKGISNYKEDKRDESIIIFEEIFSGILSKNLGTFLILFFVSYRGYHYNNHFFNTTTNNNNNNTTTNNNSYNNNNSYDNNGGTDNNYSNNYNFKSVW
jgi:hypothetical protein